MTLSVTSDQARSVGRAMLSVSTGSEADDKVTELIGTQHIQIAELVRIFSDSQRTNRDLVADISDIREKISVTATAIAEIYSSHSSLLKDFERVRTDVQTMSTLDARLTEVILLARELIAETDRYTKLSVSQFETVRLEMRANERRLEEFFAQKIVDLHAADQMRTALLADNMERLARRGIYDLTVTSWRQWKTWFKAKFGTGGR